MSRWDDDFDAPRRGPRVVESLTLSSLGQIVEDGERPLSKTPLIPRPSVEDGSAKRDARVRAAAAELAFYLR